MDVDAREFWNHKILGWEHDKYFKSEAKPRLIDFNSSVKQRMSLARNLLKSVVAGRTVLELGCGSGLLAQEIMRMGATRYLGVDFSGVAIEEAKKRNAELVEKDMIGFQLEDVRNLSGLEYDICFSLGLLDWLEAVDIEKLFKSVRSEIFIHSFSEKRLSLQLVVHRVYVHLMYGHKTGLYTPRYYKAQELGVFVPDILKENTTVMRDPKMSFGCLLTNIQSD